MKPAVFETRFAKRRGQVVNALRRELLSFGRVQPRHLLPPNTHIVNTTHRAITAAFPLKPLSFSFEVLTESELGFGGDLTSDRADSEGTAALSKLRPAPIEVTAAS